MDYFHQLPPDLQMYIHYINKSKWALEVIKKNIKEKEIIVGDSGIR
jgi:protein subunit release factor A